MAKNHPPAWPVYGIVVPLLSSLISECAYVLPLKNGIIRVRAFVWQKSLTSAVLNIFGINNAVLINFTEILLLFFRNKNRNFAVKLQFSSNYFHGCAKLMFKYRDI